MATLGDMQPGVLCWVELDDRCDLVSIAWQYKGSGTQARIGGSARAEALTVLSSDLPVAHVVECEVRHRAQQGGVPDPLLGCAA